MQFVLRMTIDCGCRFRWIFVRKLFCLQHAYNKSPDSHNTNNYIKYITCSSADGHRLAGILFSVKLSSAQRR